VQRGLGSDRPQLSKSTWCIVKANFMPYFSLPRVQVLALISNPTWNWKNWAVNCSGQVITWSQINCDPTMMERQSSQNCDDPRKLSRSIRPSLHIMFALNLNIVQSESKARFSLFGLVMAEASMPDLINQYRVVTDCDGPDAGYGTNFKIDACKACCVAVRMPSRHNRR